MRPRRTARLLLRSLAPALVIGSVAACGDSEPDRAEGGSEPTTIEGYAFDPEALTIAAGTEVIWTNRDDVTHTVTQNGGLLDSPDLGADDTYAVAFEESGTYEYFCKLHPAMRGTITVEG